MQPNTPHYPSPTLPIAKPVSIPVARPSFAPLFPPRKAIVKAQPVKAPVKSETDIASLEDLMPKPAKQARLEVKAPQPKTVQSAPAQPQGQSQQPHQSQYQYQDARSSETTLSMRDALVTLKKDVPRAIEVISTKTAIYPDGYLKDKTDFAAFLASPALITLLRVAMQSEITTLKSTDTLSDLTIPRTVQILSAITTGLEARGTTYLNNQTDIIEGESKEETSLRLNAIIEKFLAQLP